MDHIPEIILCRNFFLDSDKGLEKLVLESKFLTTSLPCWYFPKSQLISLFANMSLRVILNTKVLKMI